MSDGAQDPARPPRWHTREDSGIRLDRQLRWWHDDEPIEHPRIVEAFNVGLKPTDDGRFRLELGNDWCFVQVEEAAYLVTVLDAQPEGGLVVRLSDRTAERLDPATLSVGDDGVLRCKVKGRRALARFSRDAQFSLGTRLQQEGSRWVLAVGAARVPVPESIAGAVSEPQPPTLPIR